MTVPHDLVMCAGLGVATHLAAAEGVQLDDREKRIALGGFALGWLPVSGVILWCWPDWSWWYLLDLDATSSATRAISAGVLLAQALVFVLGMAAAGRLERPKRLLLLGLLSILYAGLMVLPWTYFGTVGSADQVLAGQGTPLLQSWGLLAVLAGGGVWLGSVGLATVLTIRKSVGARRALSGPSDPGTS